MCFWLFLPKVGKYFSTFGFIITTIDVQSSHNIKKDNLRWFWWYFLADKWYPDHRKAEVTKHSRVWCTSSSRGTWGLGSSPAPTCSLCIPAVGHRSGSGRKVPSRTPALCTPGCSPRISGFRSPRGPTLKLLFACSRGSGGRHW